MPAVWVLVFKNPLNPLKDTLERLEVDLSISQVLPSALRHYTFLILFTKTQFLAHSLGERAGDRLEDLIFGFNPDQISWLKSVQESLNLVYDLLQEFLWHVLELRGQLQYQ